MSGMQTAAIQKVKEEKNAFGCWRGKKPQSEAANLPTLCRELLASANLPLLLGEGTTPKLKDKAGGLLRWCLRVNGVVEDSRQGVVDVADHVIQLILRLQPQRVGGLVRVDDNLQVDDGTFQHKALDSSWKKKKRKRGYDKRLWHLVLLIGVHRPDFQEVEGDLHLRNSKDKLVVLRRCLTAFVLNILPLHSETTDSPSWFSRERGRQKHELAEH